MTEIAFHFNVPERLAYACRLIRKAQRHGSRVVVVASDAAEARLDQLLWTFAAREFVPHCRQATASDAVLAASPVVLGSDLNKWPHHEVMINLTDSVPEGFERFERLIEVVSGDELVRQEARLRWRHYGGRGYAILQHDLSAQG